MLTRRHAILYGVLILLLGIALGRLPATLAWLSDESPWVNAVDEARRLIRDHAVEPIDDQRLSAAAIEGMLGALDDHYAEFVPPASRADFESDLSLQFRGIGAHVAQLNAAGEPDPTGIITIVSPIQDSPALKAGLLPGDQILAIDATSTLGLTLEQAVTHLRGHPGDDVTLTIGRPLISGAGLSPAGNDPAAIERLTIPVTRAEVITPSVTGLYYEPAPGAWHHLLDSPDDPATAKGAPAYIRINQFTETTPIEFAAALIAAHISSSDASSTPTPPALILDLRDNLGGLLDSAVAIADMFLDRGDIVSTRGRPASRDASTYTAASGRLVPANLPVIILINENSASASEVLTGALTENHAARALGVRSFGKGLVQKIEPLASLPGAMIKLTEQRFYLPGGRLIQRTPTSTTWGVDPDRALTLDLTDAQLKTLYHARTELEAIRPAPTATNSNLGLTLRDPAPLATLRTHRFGDPDWITAATGDAQLAAALRAVRDPGYTIPRPVPAEISPARKATP
ncbi:S41 family peptidase [soil metagenome]